MIKDCGFYTFSQFLGRDNIGSSRIRAEWLCNYWPEAEIFTIGQEYKTVVFQKAYWPEYTTIFTGIKILDVCDVKDKDWKKIKQMISCCDGITTSTETIAEFIRQKTDKPVLCIPDRLDFNFFNEPLKEHRGEVKTVAWQGYNTNFPMLAWTIPDLVKNNITKLIVISNYTYSFPIPTKFRKKIEIVNLRWEESTINKSLLQADIVINPHFNKGKWKYKSDNKTASAWALGLPVAQTKEELKDLISEDARKKEAALRLEEVRKNYDVKKSIIELKNFINLLHGEQDMNALEPNKPNFIPDWSSNKLELIKHLNIFYKFSFSSWIDDLLGKIGIIINRLSPRLYQFLKPTKKTK